MGIQSSRQRIVCIVGPTACHKTELSIELAKRVGGEIVSADSVQVYIGMDIGSAKPTVEERQGVVHHMIDCLPIDTPEFSVSMFRTMASEAIDGIIRRNHVPIIVGGSGLYVNALTYPLGFAIPRNDEIREQVSNEYDESPDRTFRRLLIVDPATADKLHVNDKKRVVRALEVFDCSGKPLSAYGDDFQNCAGEQPPYEPMLFGLNMAREQLYTRINLRVELMVQSGLLEEAKRIYDMRYDHSLPAMRSIGYQQLFSCFDGNCTLEQAIEQIKLDTRHFSKRHLTWFKRDARISWHDVTEWDRVKNELFQELSEQTNNWVK